MSGLPTGTITFLFTDVEGSTRLWREQPESMQRALARHDEVLQATIESSGGYVFSTGGDEIVAAFERADDAVQAAVEGQHALRALEWPEPVELRVRMGLHTGTAEEREGKYFGFTVNRVARITMAAHGGQVLVSVPTSSLLPAGAVELIDLGRHRLRDLLEAEQLYQIIVDGDAGRYPPLRSLDAHDHNLPVVASALVGREDAIASVRDLVAKTRLVTLSGVGGVGKTRLALAVAAEELQRFDAVFFAELAPVSAADQVVGAVAAAMGLSPREADGWPDGASGVDRVLASRASLLVLDNCEHLLDACAELCESLLDRHPRCVMLATSREPLGLGGEHVWRVPSLDVEGGAAVELFVDRARAVRADFELDADTRRGVAAICEALDGVPLAIELAAARVSHLSVGEILEHLDERFQLLTGGRRRARQRHQTLEAAMDWSYGLLDAREREALQDSSVFVGGFTLEALQAVAVQPAAAVLDALGSLVDKSLVEADAQRDGSTRYRLLETVRLYGLAKLVEGGRAAQLRQHHAVWLAGLIDAPLPRLDPIGLSGERGAVDAELSNALAGLEWAEATGDLQLLGRITWVAATAGFGDWVDLNWRYLGREDVVAALDDDRARSLYLAGSALDANKQGRWQQQYEWAMRSAEVAADPEIQAWALMLAGVAASTFDPDLCDRLTDRGLALSGLPHWLGHALLLNKAIAPLMRGDLTGGIPLLEQCAALGSDYGELGLVHHVLGNHEAAAQCAGEAANLAETFMSYRQDMLRSLAAADAGQHQEAARHLLAVARRAQRFPNTLMDVDAIITAGAVAHLAGDSRHAARLLAVIGETPRARTPASWHLFLHTQRTVHHRLTREEVDAIRREAAGLSVPDALEQEIRSLEKRSQAP